MNRPEGARRWTAPLLVGIGVLAALDVALPSLATNHPPRLADLLAGLTLLWCGAELVRARAVRAQGGLLCAAGVAWFLPDLAVTGWATADTALAHLALLHVPFLVAALLVVPSPGLRTVLDRSAVVAASVAVATSVTGGWEVALPLTGALVVAAVVDEWRRAAWPRSRAWAVYGAGALAYGGTLVVAQAARALGWGDWWLPTVYAAAVAGAGLAVASAGTRLRATIAVDVGPTALARIDGLVAGALRYPGAELRVRLADGQWADVRGRLVADEGPDVWLDDGLGLRLPTSGAQGNESVTGVPLEDGLLRDAVTLAARNVRLGAAAEVAVLEQAALRGRLVTVEDEERRGLVDRLRAGPLTRLEALAADLREGGVPEALVSEVEHTEVALRAIALGLDPVGESGSLLNALTDLADACPVTTHLECEEVTLPAPAARALWFACSELLANVSKHAPEAVVTVTLTQGGGAATLAVADDGPGGADPGGGGLRGIRDRVAAVGGTVHVASSPHGSVVRVVIPTPRDTCHRVARTRSTTDVPDGAPLVPSVPSRRQEQ